MSNSGEPVLIPPVVPMENRVRALACRILNAVEVVIYAILGLLLAATALIALGGAALELSHTFAEWNDVAEAIQVVEQLLFVLMLIEILHTVRISIQSHRLVTEPFLIVAIIASVRRMLVITMEGSELTKPAAWKAGGESVFRASLIELGLLGGIVLVLAVAIVLIRKAPGAPVGE